MVPMVFLSRRSESPALCGRIETTNAIASSSDVAWNLLLGRIRSGLAMLNLWSRERIKDFTMGSV
jgi:hypothetical protein